MSEFCSQCNEVTKSRVVEHPSGTEWLCAVCGYQVDFMDSGDDEASEPVGSCDDCGTNLYEDDDPELCDQCLWARRPRL